MADPDGSELDKIIKGEVAAWSCANRKDPKPEDYGYDPKKPGWHDYSTPPAVVCKPQENCSPQEMGDYMARHGVPGRAANNPVRHGEYTTVRDPRIRLGGKPFIPGGTVRTDVSENGLEVVNRTLPNHILHDGVVVRQACQNPDNSWSVHTRGFGNNAYPLGNRLNNWQGPGIFNQVNREMRENIRQHHGSEE